MDKKRGPDRSGADDALACVRMYTKKDCHLCAVARNVIFRVRKDVSFRFEEVDIESDAEAYREFKEKIPVVFVNGKQAFRYKVNERGLRRILNMKDRFV